MNEEINEERHTERHTKTYIYIEKLSFILTLCHHESAPQHQQNEKRNMAGPKEERKKDRQTDRQTERKKEVFIEIVA